VSHPLLVYIYDESRIITPVSLCSRNFFWCRLSHDVLLIKIRAATIDDFHNLIWQLLSWFIVWSKNCPKNVDHNLPTPKLTSFGALVLYNWQSKTPKSSIYHHYKQKKHQIQAAVIYSDSSRQYCITSSKERHSNNISGQSSRAPPKKYLFN